MHVFPIFNSNLWPPHPPSSRAPIGEMIAQSAVTPPAVTPTCSPAGTPSALVRTSSASTCPTWSTTRLTAPSWTAAPLSRPPPLLLHCPRGTWVRSDLWTVHFLWLDKKKKFIAAQITCLTCICIEEGLFVADALKERLTQIYVTFWPFVHRGDRCGALKQPDVLLIEVTVVFTCVCESVTTIISVYFICFSPVIRAGRDQPVLRHQLETSFFRSDLPTAILLRSSQHAPTCAPHEAHINCR